MATRKSYYPRPSYLFLSTDQSYHTNSDSGFEFDESDLYSSAVSVHSDSPWKISTSGRVGIKKSCNQSAVAVTKVTSASLPMNVPDWSEILRKKNRKSYQREIDSDEEDYIDDGDRLESGGGGGRLPPHEFLARTRMASFSVHEGIGRTLKGRDLSRVRNSILEKTGFLD